MSKITESVPYVEIDMTAEGVQDQPSTLDQTLMTMGDALAEYALRSLHHLMSR